jgi:lipopolysaccharide export system permease protein
MPKRYFRYIAWHYGKNFLILLLGLSLAVVFIDFLQNAQKLGDGFNRKILYAFYTWEYMLTLIYPLVILFALAWTQISFIYRNVFVSLFSFGYRRRQLLRPFLAVATLVYLVFLLLQTTPFAQGRDQARAIIDTRATQEKVEDLFFKYNDSFVFVRQLDPLHKELHDGMIFRLKGRRVVETTRFPLARFKEGRWEAPRATIRTKLFDRNGTLVSYRDREIEGHTVLEGYRPKIFRQIYEGRSLTLQDALEAWRLLAAQGLSADKVKSTLYNQVVMPLFALALLVILFFRTPPYHRFIRKERLWITFLGSSMLLWALLFALYRLGINGAIDPDYGQSVTVLLLALYALRLYLKERRVERPA